MTAETLRRASALMRERAEGATPSPWHVCGDSSVDADSAVTDGDHDPVAALMDEWYEVAPDEPTAVHDAAHIASWHPAVALAVADWLDRDAEGWELLLAAGLPDMDSFACALAVARTYLGEDA